MTNKQQNKSNVPNLRFPGFEEEWEEKRFGDLVEFKITNSFSRENLNYQNGTLKNIHYGDIHTKFPTLLDISTEKLPFINNALSIDRISEDNYCQEGDIVFADASEDLNDVGKSIEIVNLNNEKVLAGLHTILARPQKDIFHKGFVGYLLKSTKIRTQIQKESQGSKVLSISAGRISKIELSFPLGPEQQKIALFLSLIDQRIESQNKIIGELKSLNNSLRENLFLRHIRFKSVYGSANPDWQEMALGDVGDIKMCRRIFNEETTSVGEVPFFKIGSFGKKADAYIPRELYEDYKKRFSFPKKGDILISAAGTIGRTVIYNGEDAYFQDSNIVWIDNDSSKVSNEFLFYVLQIVKYNTEGGTIQRLYNNILKSTKFTCPDLSEQNKIATFLSRLEQKIELEKRILKGYKNQKQYFSRNLFI